MEGRKSMSIMIKDPTQMVRFMMNHETEEATLCVLIDYYVERKTIPVKDGISLKEMVNSPDKENMVLAKTLLQLRYQLL
jgi:hypothetical protein